MRISVCLGCLLTVMLGWATAASSEALKTQNVVLIVLDGLRWQEVFNGADPLLINNEKAGGSWTPLPKLKAEFWADDVQARRKRVMPFLWGTVAQQGEIFGNQALGSRAVVTNPFWFSYPGYNEMATGSVDLKIKKNEFGPNPNQTVFGWLNENPRFQGQVEIFGNWSVFHDIFNSALSHLPIRAGDSLVERTATTPEARLLRELYETTTRLEESDPMDSFVQVVLREHLATHHPKVLFVGYGDTDNWGHLGRYDNVLTAARSADAFIGALWAQMQSIPQYRDQTTFIITTDHGRGGGRRLWREHGVKDPGSENVWIAVMGPDTPALGERSHVATVTQSQIAATVAALVGEDYLGFNPKAGLPLPIFK